MNFSKHLLTKLLSVLLVFIMLPGSVIVLNANTTGEALKSNDVSWFSFAKKKYKNPTDKELCVNVTTDNFEENPIKSYESNTTSGVVGQWGEQDFDHPSDNVFTILIEDSLASDAVVYLQYRMEGLQDYSNIACSVNDRLSFGGYMQKSSNVSSYQKVRIHPLWLLQGKNHITFALPESAKGLGCKISDLAIVVEGNDKVSSLVVNTSNSAYDGKCYVHGFAVKTLTGRLQFNGQELELINGEFEAIVDYAEELVFSFVQEDGEFSTHTMTLEHQLESDNTLDYNKTYEVELANFKANTSVHLGNNLVKLYANDSSLLQSKTLSITNLRAHDVASMELGMTNVTAGNEAYRFLPHGEHFSPEEAASVAIAYDKTRIPVGYTEDDIQTFYFDLDSKHWVALEKDSVDKEQCLVVSRTTHFTDMINGVVVAPETPDQNAFTPTMMSGLDAANPASNIQLLAPPTVNNSGSANLNYPIALAPLAGSVQPNLAITYSSDRGSGWLGQGWDLNISTIAVDTRWGVPRYDPNYETETYNLDGQMLALMVDDQDIDTAAHTVSLAHRNRTFYDRKQTKVRFFKRIMNDFSEISRDYNETNGYYWTVRATNGVEYEYNEKLSDTVNSFRYSDISRKMQACTVDGTAEWYLSQVSAPYGYFCRYSYNHIVEESDSKAVYPSEIVMGRNDTVFQRVVFYSHSQKTLNKVNARYGFLRSSNALLDSVAVFLLDPSAETNNEQKVRSYTYQYTDGEFGAKLLSSISQCDANGQIVASHQLDYTNMQDDTPLYELMDNLSLPSGVSLSKSTTTSNGENLSISGGIDLGVLEAGASYAHGRNESATTGNMIYIDINGDGLPDKVSYSNGELSFEPNLGAFIFGNSEKIEGIDKPYSRHKSISKTNGVGVSASVGISDVASAGVNGGIDWGDSYSQTYNYFTDVNNDNLVDIVINRKVYFNYIKEYKNGVAIPAFSLDSRLTQNPMYYTTSIRTDTEPIKPEHVQRNVEIYSQEEIDQLNAMPFQDAVLCFKAPDSGRYELNTPISWDPTLLGTDPSGVFFSIEVNGEMVKGVHFKDNMQSESLDDTVILDQGDFVYYRLQSDINFYGDDYGDRINVKPKIRFLDGICLDPFVPNENEQINESTISEESINPGAFTYNGGLIYSYRLGDATFNHSLGGFTLKADSSDLVFNLYKGYHGLGSLSDISGVKVYYGNDSLLHVRDSVVNESTDSMVVYNIYEANPNYVKKELIYHKFYEQGRTRGEYSEDDMVLPRFDSINTHYWFEVMADHNVSWNGLYWQPRLRYANLPCDSVGTETCTEISEDLYWPAPLQFKTFNKRVKKGEIKKHVSRKFEECWVANSYPDIIQPDYDSLLIETRNEYYSSIADLDYGDDSLTIKVTTNRKMHKDVTMRCRLMSNCTNGYTVTMLDVGEQYPMEDNLDANDYYHSPYEFTIRAGDSIVEHKIKMTTELYSFLYSWPSDWSSNELDTMCYHCVSGEKGIFYAELYVQDDEYYGDDTLGVPYESAIVSAARSHYYKLEVNASIYKYTSPDDPEYQLGALWRGWGQFQYNAAAGRFAKPIEYDNLYQPDSATFDSIRIFSMKPHSYDDIKYISSRDYKGLGSNVFINGYVFSAGRLYGEDKSEDKSAPQLNIQTDDSGETTVPLIVTKSATVNDDNVDKDTMLVYLQEIPASVSPTFGQSIAEHTDDNFRVYDAPVLQSYTDSRTWSVGASLSAGAPVSNDMALGVSIGASYSKGKSDGRVTSAYLDMNGDGYPDCFADEVIEYSNPFGGRDGEIYEFDGGQFETSHSENESYGLSTGRYIHPSSSTTSDEGSVQMASSIASMSGGAVWSSNTENKTSGFVDINGDGLPDRLFKKDGTIKVRLNLGYGFESEERELSLEAIHSASASSDNFSASFGILGVSKGKSVGTSQVMVLKDLKDINADGLLDYIYLDGSGDVYVRYNLGMDISETAVKLNLDGIGKNSSESTSKNSSVSIPLRYLIYKLTTTYSKSSATSESSQNDDFMDMDGDGYADYIADNGQKIYRSNIGALNKLSTVSNSLGGEFTIAYDRTKATHDHPKGKEVMRVVEVNDGISDDGNVSKMMFAYDAGMYDRTEREFLGFQGVYSHQIDTDEEQVHSSTYQHYDASNYYTKNNLLSTKLLDGEGNELQTEEYENYKYSVKTRNTTDEMGNKASENYVEDLGEPDLNTNKLTQYVMYSPLKYTRSTYLDDVNGESLTLNETYRTYKEGGDSHGELRAYYFSDQGDLASSNNLNYNYKTTYDYNHCNDNHRFYVFGLPKEATTTNPEGDVLRQHFAAWDFQTNPDRYFIKFFKEMIDGDSIVTNFTYDNLGNVKTKTLPPNKNDERLQMTYTYDSVYQQFPVNISDNLGYSSSIDAYDYRFGLPTRTTDMNGNVMLTEYDDLGRVSSITGPNEYDASNPEAYTIKYEYKPQANSNDNGITDPAYAITKHYDPQNPNDDLHTVTLTDGFGKAIQVKKESVVDGEHKMVVSGRVKYDAMGRAIESYHPTTESYSFSGLSDFNQTFDNVTPAKTTYDVRNRVLTSTTPGDHTTTMNYGLEDGLLRTTTTDAKGQKQSTYTTGAGLTDRTIQLGKDNHNITTQYRYDAIGQLTEVINPKGDTTINVYDQLGRLSSVDHPVSGITSYSYDKLGNMVSKQTANLALADKYITYDYYYNQLREVQYPYHSENNVRYWYGDSTAQDNTAGRLSYMEDASGARQYTYDKMGNIATEKRTLVVPNEGIVTYDTQWEYDSWNRITKLIYPDGETLTYNYNQGGLLDGITNDENYSYIHSLLYDKFEQKTAMTYGNGATTTYDYDPQDRQLDKLKVIANNQTLRDNSYAYDAVYNITSITNNGADIDGGTVSTQHSYQYDDLNRLITANGYVNPTNSTSSYTTTMSYDNMGNITRKQQTINQENIQFDGALEVSYDLSYNYEGNPLQISSINETGYRMADTDKQNDDKDHHYSYDANGNLLWINTGTYDKNTDKVNVTAQRSHLWDEENRLLAISVNGNTSNYWYDAAGERSLKVTEASISSSVNGELMASNASHKFTAYISPYLVLNSGGYYSKHIYVGSQRITTKLQADSIFATSPVMLSFNLDTFSNVSYAGSINFADKKDSLTAKLIERHELIGTPYLGRDNDNNGFRGDNIPTMSYFYHADHLGSSSQITDGTGQLVQHLEYLPFGEVFLDRSSSSLTWNTPYKFSGKELDPVTGLYYFGARYYDPRTSVWLGVDPLAHKYPSFSPYVYCYNNPVMFIDPNGMEGFTVDNKGVIERIQNQKANAYGGQEHDILFNKGEYEHAVSNGIVNKAGNPYVENNSGKLKPGMLKQMSEEKLVTEVNFGSSSMHGILKGYFGETNDFNTAASIFKFAAENSDREWSYQEFKSGNFVVGTSREKDVTLTGRYLDKYKNDIVNVDIHSHWHGGLQTNSSKLGKDDDTGHAARIINRNSDARVYLFAPNSTGYKFMGIRPYYYELNDRSLYYKPVYNEIRK